MTEDLSIFFADCGVDGTLGGQPVRVLFDAPSDAMLGGGMVAQQPQALIASASVPASPEGLPLVVPQGTYSVRTHLPDGTGISTLLLSKA